MSATAWLFVIAGFVLVGETGQPTLPPRQALKTFFPMVQMSTRYRGIAWCAGCGGQHAGDLQTYQANAWYAGWYENTEAQFAGSRIPIVRARQVDKAAALGALGYAGPTLWLNEPDRADQDDMTPGEAAAEWPYVQAACPTCKWVMPNVSQLGMDWLAEFVALSEGEPWRWSFHLYLSPPYSLDDSIQGMCTITGTCVALWLTEYGTCIPDLAESFFEQVDADRRLEANLYFTNRNSIAEGSCSALIDEAGNETFYGETYRDVYVK